MQIRYCQSPFMLVSFRIKYVIFFSILYSFLNSFLSSYVIRKRNDLLWRCRRGYHRDDRTTRWGLALKWIVKSFLPPLDSVHEHMYRMLCKQIAGVRPLFSRKLHLLLFLWDPFLFSLRLSFTPPRCSLSFWLSLSDPSFYLRHLSGGEGIESSRSVYPAGVFECRSNAP